MRTRWLLLPLALLVWEGFCRTGWVSPILLASPSDILRAALLHGVDFLAAFQTTLGEILVATAASWVLGIASGVVAGSVRPLGRITAPFLSALFAVPHIIWYPLLVAVFGLGSGSKVWYGLLAGYFPIALTTLEAVRQLDRRFATLARSFGAGNLRIMASIVVPFALPGIISGLRIGTALVVIGVVVSEMLGSLDGIGYLISYYRTSFETGAVYLGIILALVFAMATNLLLSRLERRFGRWRALQELSG